MAAISKTHVLDLESGSTQYASIADASQTGLSLTSSFSVSFWINPESLPNNNQRMAFVSKYDVTGGGYEIGFFRTGGGVLQLETRIRQNASTEDVKVQAVTTIGFASSIGSNNKWYHVCVVADYSGGTLSLYYYVDGFDRVGAQTGTTTSVGTNTSEFAIGARSAGSNFYDGYISDVRVYSGTLTADQVVALMRHYRNTAASVGQWRFNGDYTDASPNGNTLIATGSPTFNTSSFPFITYGRTTRFFVGPGDGYIENSSNTSWDTAHDATSGTVVDDTATTLVVKSELAGGFHIFRRAFLPVDTSGFDGDLQILGGALGLNQTSANAGSNNDLCLVQTSQADPTNLVAEDFDQCGSINSPTEGATRKGSTLAATVNWMDLNSSGITWISKSGYTLLGLRVSRDVDDDDYPSPTTDSVTVKTSETSGTVNDPFLDVVDDDEFYGGSTDEGGAGGGAGDFGGVDLGGGSGSGPGEYTPPVGGGIGGSGEGGASNENTVALAGIFFVE